ncbi:hypothetical protein TWF730_002305 [Orbilia blumenaviensis]|uniref:F-box domain-containing protein n=1 Tax=Orbilia blumenaviensis TaxID=1796055 RepID=A0AAV9U9G9_9PEZI
MTMATLSSLPTEVFNEIVGHLPRRSQLILRQCSKTLEGKSDYDNLFKSQRYYHSIVDLQTLVAFSSDPAHTKARLKCKTLLVDAFSPCSMNIRCKVKVGDQKTTELIRLKTPRLEKQRVIEFLATALDNLPNLQCIQFANTLTVREVPNAILQSHYPDLGFDIREGKVGKWFKEAYQKATEYADIDDVEDTTFSNVMEAIAQSAWQPKMIRFLGLTELGKWSWDSSTSIPIQSPGNGPSFRWLKDTERTERLRLKLQGLKGLEMPLWLGDPTDFDYEEMFSQMESARAPVTRLLEMLQNVEELRFKVGGLVRIAMPKNMGVRLQPHPPNPMDVGSLKFNNLRIVSLIEQSFVESELAKFLISHKDTLREVEFHNCLLHSEQQIWSDIFKLLRTDLWLWSFEFHTEYPRLPQNTTEQIRIVPWFRVYGNVRTSDHRCELFPKGEKHKQDNQHHITFDQAMQVVAVLEGKFIKNDSGVDNEQQSISDKLKQALQGISPDDPGTRLHERQIQPVVQQLLYRRTLMKFRGIQPRDIKDEIVALGIQGFEIEDNVQKSGPSNSFLAAQSAQRRTDLKFIVQQ